MNNFYNIIIFLKKIILYLKLTLSNNFYLVILSLLQAQIFYKMLSGF